MENKEELVSSLEVLMDVFDNFNNEKRHIVFDGDGLHIEIYDKPEEFLNVKIGDKHPIPLLIFKLVEANGNKIEAEKPSCYEMQATSGYVQTELERNLDLLNKMLRINTEYNVSLNTEELETRINTLIKNNEF